MRRLCSLAGGRSRSYAERFPSLLDPLPGLRLPPGPHDEHQSPPQHTEVTTLPNGVRIASQDIPGPMCCVGVTVAAGSVHETPSSAGAAYMLERLAFQETQNRGVREIAHSVEATGGKLGAKAGREKMFYTFGALRDSLPLAVELLLDCVRNPAFLRSQVRNKVAEAREELSFLERNPQLFLRESLHRVGYSGALGNPLYPTMEALGRIDRGAIRNFFLENYTADRLVLAASGVNHQHLLDIASPLLSDLPKGSSVNKPKSAYTGGDFRHKTDSEITHVALAFEVPGGWQQGKAAVIMKVIQTLMGGGASFSNGGPGKGMQSRLYLRVMTEYDWMQSISAFSTVYDDTGLFGIHLATENYTADRLVLAASGVSHQHLLDIASPLLSDLPKGSHMNKPKSAYTGGDFRHKTDSEVTHLAMAFEVPGGWRQEKAAAITKVIQTLMGGGASFSNGGPGKGMQSRLYLRVMTEYDWMQSISAFSTVYDETGLFGIHLAAPSNSVAEAVDIAIKELTAIAIPGEVTEAELSQAKNSTISSVLQNLESRKNHAEDIGRQILIGSSGKAGQHFLERVDEVTLDDIMLVAQKLLSSCPTMASWGDVDKVPTHEYDRGHVESPPSDLMWTLKRLFS